MQVGPDKQRFLVKFSKKFKSDLVIIGPGGRLRRTDSSTFPTVRGANVFEPLILIDGQYITAFDTKRKS